MDFGFARRCGAGETFGRSPVRGRETRAQQRRLKLNPRMVQ
jgi:hypothetical protein